MLVSLFVLEMSVSIYKSRVLSGQIRKKWNRLFMSLDEESSVLRWWKTDERKSMDAAIYTKLVTDHYMTLLFHLHNFAPRTFVCRFCVGVLDHCTEGIVLPEDTADRCFVFQTNTRDFYLIAETAGEKT